MERHGLVALESPLPIDPSAFSFIWGFHLENDPGSNWFRGQVMRVYEDLRQSVAVQTAAWHIVKVSKSRKRK